MKKEIVVADYAVPPMVTVFRAACAVEGVKDLQPNVMWTQRISWGSLVPEMFRCNPEDRTRNLPTKMGEWVSVI
ncbi:hypothetical protein R4282_06695 [Rhodococcus oxybenzonivorans]|uniref:hypothetical protein n=1 Tax=Rhodococcus oxybenzonivorans TaxID=1990687 RepID=UPI0029542306|nr:hypothetical protein [Rhodococcus oxybenzonivorans]MDV7352704.1 hypothetical protein [Rhodococcus oxybenzonivorans]